MSQLSGSGRRLLERYKAAESMPPAGKARLLANLLQAEARGTLPRFEASDTLPALPRAAWPRRAWASPVGKPLIAAVFLALPVLAVSLAQRSTPGADSNLQSSAPLPVKLAPPSRLPETAQEAPQAPPPEPALPPDAPKRKVRATPASKSSVAASSKDLAQEPTIDGEMRLLNQAQSANQSGDPRRALNLLDEYAARYPAGRLADVRAVARLVALCQLGQVNVLRQEAARFQAQYPNSPFNERVKGICATKTRP